MQVLLDIKKTPVILSATSAEVVKWINDNYETLSETHTPEHRALSIYDGVDRRFEINRDVNLLDILITIGFNSNIYTASMVEDVYMKIPQLKEWCDILSRTAEKHFHKVTFEEDSPLVQVFVEGCISKRVPHLQMANLSKILHKKFPMLVPVLDSLFVQFYRRQYRLENHKRNWRPSPQERNRYYVGFYVNLFNTIKNDVCSNILILEDVCSIIEQRTGGRLVLSPLRVWDLLVWDYERKQNDETNKR